MFIEIYGIAILAALFGYCAVWNRRQGIRKGIYTTLHTLVTDKIIEVKGNKIIPFGKENG